MATCSLRVLSKIWSQHMVGGIKRDPQRQEWGHKQLKLKANQTKNASQASKDIQENNKNKNNKINIEEKHDN